MATLFSKTERKMNFSLLINNIVILLTTFNVMNLTDDWFRILPELKIMTIITLNIYYNLHLLFLFIVIVNTTFIMTWIMMVRRHVTATLSIIGRKWTEDVFSTSFLHCSYILRESWTSDWSVTLTDSNV